MELWNQRTELLLGNEGITILASKSILVVGVGGVGAYAAEMLVRTGIGDITIVDGDIVNVTNLNRQLIALNSTLNQCKVETMKKRLKDINPNVKVTAIPTFLTTTEIPILMNCKKYDFVIDAIDTVAPKVALIEYCLKNKIKIISSMGAGGRLDPTVVQYADISATYHDGLAKAVRNKLKECGIKKGLPVVWSPEAPKRSSLMLTSEMKNKRSSYGTISYMPAIFGNFLAAYVIKKLLSI